MSLSYLDLTSEQWTLAHEMTKVLKPFEVATTFLCEDTTISSTLPIIHGLVDNLKADDSDSRVLANFKETVKDEVTQRWELQSLDITSSVVLSAFIDPHFKSTKFLDEEQIEQIKIELVRRMEALESEELLICDEEQPRKRKKTAMDIIFGGRRGTYW